MREREHEVPRDLLLTSIDEFVASLSKYLPGLVRDGQAPGVSSPLIELLDSLEVLELIVLIESQFGIEIDEMQIDEEEIPRICLADLYSILSDAARPGLQ
ncbi:MAG: acyl carrier protein [Acidimicrobiia bacterium]|nr:acyl carrier protein [Acidimicrobiia bacterium]